MQLRRGEARPPRVPRGGRADRRARRLQFQLVRGRPGQGPALDPTSRRARSGSPAAFGALAALILLAQALARQAEPSVGRLPDAAGDRDDRGQLTAVGIAQRRRRGRRRGGGGGGGGDRALAADADRPRPGSRAAIPASRSTRPCSSTARRRSLSPCSWPAPSRRRARRAPRRPARRARALLARVSLPPAMLAGRLRPAAERGSGAVADDRRRDRRRRRRATALTFSASLGRLLTHAQALRPELGLRGPVRPERRPRPARGRGHSRPPARPRAAAPRPSAPARSARERRGSSA